LRAREQGNLLPVGFACDVVKQVGASLIALERTLAHANSDVVPGTFNSTVRALVFSRDGRVHWVDPFGLDDPSPLKPHRDNQAEEITALGALLYELCVGRAAPSPGEVVDFALVAPSTFREELPDSVDALCARALGFAPGQRFASAEEFVDALTLAAIG